MERLSALSEAVNLERADLGRLHKIDAAATAAAQMVQDYALEKERMKAEIAEQQAGQSTSTKKISGCRIRNSRRRSCG